MSVLVVKIFCGDSEIFADTPAGVKRAYYHFQSVLEKEKDSLYHYQRDAIYRIEADDTKPHPVLFTAKESVLKEEDAHPCEKCKRPLKGDNCGRILDPDWRWPEVDDLIAKLYPEPTAPAPAAEIVPDVATPVVHAVAIGGGKAIVHGGSEHDIGLEIPCITPSNI